MTPILRAIFIELVLLINIIEVLIYRLLLVDPWCKHGILQS
jgi:hypothetical protein